MSDKLIRMIKDYGFCSFKWGKIKDQNIFNTCRKDSDKLMNEIKETIQDCNRNPVAKKLEDIYNDSTIKFEKSEYDLISDLILFFDGTISLDNICIQNNLELYDIPYIKRHSVRVIIIHINKISNRLLLSFDCKELLQLARVLKKISEYFEGIRNFNSILD